MDEARAVIGRLDRIGRLEREGAPAPELLAELRALVVEAEAWVRAEPGGTEAARVALARLEERLERDGRRAAA